MSCIVDGDIEASGNNLEENLLLNNKSGKDALKECDFYLKLFGLSQNGSNIAIFWFLFIIISFMYNIYTMGRWIAMNVSDEAYWLLLTPCTMLLKLCAVTKSVHDIRTLLESSSSINISANTLNAVIKDGRIYFIIINISVITCFFVCFICFLVTSNDVNNAIKMIFMMICACTYVIVLCGISWFSVSYARQAILELTSLLQLSKSNSLVDYSVFRTHKNTFLELSNECKHLSQHVLLTSLLNLGALIAIAFYTPTYMKEQGWNHQVIIAWLIALTVYIIGSDVAFLAFLMPEMATGNDIIESFISELLSNARIKRMDIPCDTTSPTCYSEQDSKIEAIRYQILMELLLDHPRLRFDMFGYTLNRRQILERLFGLLLALVGIFCKVVISTAL